MENKMLTDKNANFHFDILNYKWTDTVPIHIRISTMYANIIAGGMFQTVS